MLRPVAAAPTAPSPARAAASSPLHLVAAAARGDRLALEALARWSQPVIAAQARRVLGGRRDPARDDVVEEVCAEVQAFLAGGAEVGAGPGWRRFERGRAAASVEAWLFGIVRNKARRRLRDARRGGAIAARLAAGDGGACGWGVCGPSPERAVDAARAVHLLGTLPPRERAALVLWMDDAPSREIAARLRFASPHAVECVLSRGKQRLRRLMEGEVRAAA